MNRVRAARPAASRGWRTEMVRVGSRAVSVGASAKLRAKIDPLATSEPDTKEPNIEATQDDVM